MKKLLMFLLTFNLFAGVNFKNGNFYMSYTDVVVTGEGEDLNLTRTYNSRSLYKGWFGNGWGTDFETWIEKTGDGTLITHESGGGMTTEFVANDGKSIDETVNAILAAATKKGVVGQALANLKKQLPTDAALRRREAKRYGLDNGALQGNVFLSTSGGSLQKITIQKDGSYVRDWDYLKQYFNKEGKLVSVRHNTGYRLDLEYVKGELRSIKDSYAKQLFFSWTSNGQIECAWNKTNKKSCYKYTNGNLSHSKDQNGNEYTYAYDKRHNLTKITYKDGLSREMKYDPRTMRIIELKDPNREVTKYSYGANTKTPDLHYWVEVTKDYPPAEGETKGYSVGPNRYEYEFVVNARGERVTKAITTVVHGLKRVTQYDKDCKLPLSIQIGSDITTFKYNKQCLLVEKMGGDKKVFAKIDYNKANKISKVVNQQGAYAYTYDTKGNLTSVAFKGQLGVADGTLASFAIRIAYNHLNQITNLTESKSYVGGKDRKPSSEAKLTFTYANGRPVEIVSEGVGKIQIEYDKEEQITNVDSNAAPEVSLAITQSLQLLAMGVNPDGVNYREG